MNRHPSYKYQFEVVRLPDGQGLGRRDVPAAVLEGVREQVLFAGQRCGMLGPELSDVVLLETPLFGKSDGGQIDGLTMSIGAGEQRLEQTFDLTMFESFASSVTADLLTSKLLAAEDQVTFRIFAQPNEGYPLSAGAEAHVNRHR